MKRDIYKSLAKWKKSKSRKPLIVEGARQVGKTYALKYFAKKFFEKVVYLNFEKDKNLADYFKSSLDPKKLIKSLSLHFGISIEPENTIIIFDEVQECPEALNSLKYFCEEASDYYIVAAGSLLGIKVKHKRGFPVGKVNFLHLYPMNFFEFLSATNNERLREYLESYEIFEPITSPIHDKLIEILKYYLFVGGMPEAVYKYVKYDDLNLVREVQEDILNAYEKDFSKHAPKYQIMKIITIWNQIHKQLAKENKKFIFSCIRKSARGREFEEAIEWLKDAGLIYKSYNIETPKLPLKAYANENIFKIFLLDVGLLGALSNLSAKTIIQKNKLFTEFKGALTENFVAEELMASNHENLFYWTSKGTAEIDFIIEKEGEIYPLEVKAGNNKRKKSLIIYGKKYLPSKLLRVTSMNLKRDKNIYNYPLYLSGRISKFLKIF